MATLTHHLQHHLHKVRSGPEHIRKQVALGGALVVTALIALIWASYMIFSGALAVQGTSFADAGAPAASAPTSSGSVLDSLIGGVGSAFSNAPTAPAALQVESQSSDAPAATPAPATVIPF